MLKAGYFLAACTALCASCAAANSLGFYLNSQLPRESRKHASLATTAREDYSRLPRDYDYCAAGYASGRDYTPPVENGELILVQLIMRHGDRTPLSPHTYNDVTWDCDGDNQFSFLTSNLTGIQPDRAIVTRELVTIPIDGPYSSGTWSGSCYVGQLTPRGAAYQREVGEEIRKIYIDKLKYLPKTFNESAGLYVRSAALGRTKQSASRLISGLYPNKFRPDDTIINMVTVPTDIEYMTRNYRHCPRQAKLIKKMMRSKEYRKHLRDNKQLWKKLRSAFGEPYDSIWPQRSFIAFLDYVAPRRCYLLPLPCKKSSASCLTDEDVDSVFRNAHWEFEYLFRDAERSEDFTRVTTGPFLTELRDSVFRHAKAVAEKDRVRPPSGSGGQNNDGSEDFGSTAFEIYSTHEETLAGLLGAFKAKDMRVPPYSSNIIVELWRSPAGMGVAGRYDDFFVRILYNGKVIEAPWCDLNACPVEVVWQYTKPLIPEDIQTECGVKRQEDEDEDDDFDFVDLEVGGDLAGFEALSEEETESLRSLSGSPTG